MTQDVASYKTPKSLWNFKALTPRAREKFLFLLDLPSDFEGDVFLTGIPESRYSSTMALFASFGLNTDPPEPVKVDTKRYTDF
jgi:hypothetical protein